jgi:hypothetical protein
MSCGVCHDITEKLTTCKHAYCDRCIAQWKINAPKYNFICLECNKPFSKQKINSIKKQITKIKASSTAYVQTTPKEEKSLTSRCPRCNIAYYKDGGCDTMYCVCGCQFRHASKICECCYQTKCKIRYDRTYMINQLRNIAETNSRRYREERNSYIFLLSTIIFCTLLIHSVARNEREFYENTMNWFEKNKDSFVIAGNSYLLQLPEQIISNTSTIETYYEIIHYSDAYTINIYKYNVYVYVSNKKKFVTKMEKNTKLCSYINSCDTSEIMRYI